jgi:hypothetical protein
MRRVSYPMAISQIPPREFDHPSQLYPGVQGIVEYMQRVVTYGITSIRRLNKFQQANPELENTYGWACLWRSWNELSYVKLGYVTYIKPCGNIVFPYRASKHTSRFYCRVDHNLNFSVRTRVSEHITKRSIFSDFLKLLWQFQSTTVFSNQ